MRADQKGAVKESIRTWEASRNEVGDKIKEGNHRLGEGRLSDLKVLWRLCDNWRRDI